MNNLKKRIEAKEAVVGVIGLGYVGLPLAVELAIEGFLVKGIEINEDRVREVNSGKSPIDDIPDEKLAAIVSKGKLVATQDYGIVDDLDIIVICVPTPLNKLRDPDLSFLLDAMEGMRNNLSKGILVILESTTYPGTTREVVLSELEESGLKAGRDFFLAFSPERIDPGNQKYGIRNTPKVVGGITKECTDLAVLFYEQFVESVVRVTSTETAEVVKLLENTFRSINIALVNEMAIMCDKLGVDVWEVVDAAATKPFGFMRFTPGPGLGGHCIPVDPHYLSWKMRTLDYKARFIELATEVNTEMPHYVADLVVEGLNRLKKSTNGAKILIVGVAYKLETDDIRESPALDIMEILEERGADLIYHDPHVPEMEWNGNEFRSQELTAELVRTADAVVIVTNHSKLNLKLIVDQAKLVIDTRNAVNGSRGNVLKLGAL